MGNKYIYRTYNYAACVDDFLSRALASMGWRPVLVESFLISRQVVPKALMQTNEEPTVLPSRGMSKDFERRGSLASCLIYMEIGSFSGYANSLPKASSLSLETTQPVH